MSARESWSGYSLYLFANPLITAAALRGGTRGFNPSAEPALSSCARPLKQYLLEKPTSSKNTKLYNSITAIPQTPPPPTPPPPPPPRPLKSESGFCSVPAAVNSLRIERDGSSVLFWRLNPGGCLFIRRALRRMQFVHRSVYSRERGALAINHRRLVTVVWRVEHADG